MPADQTGEREEEKNGWPGGGSAPKEKKPLSRDQAHSLYGFKIEKTRRG